MNLSFYLNIFIGDFKIGGRIINKLRSVDDVAIIAKTQKELQV